MVRCQFVSAYVIQYKKYFQAWLDLETPRFAKGETISLIQSAHCFAFNSYQICFFMLCS